MLCKKFRQKLMPYLEGALSDAERERVTSHLAGCAECSAELDGLQEVRSVLLRAQIPTLDPAPDLRARVTARIAPSRRSTRRFAAGMVSATALAGVIVAAVFVLRVHDEPLMRQPFHDVADSLGGGAVEIPRSQPHAAPAAPALAKSDPQTEVAADAPVPKSSAEAVAPVVQPSGLEGASFGRIATGDADVIASAAAGEADSAPPVARAGVPALGSAMARPRVATAPDLQRQETAADSAGHGAPAVMAGVPEPDIMVRGDLMDARNRKVLLATQQQKGDHQRVVETLEQLLKAAPQESPLWYRDLGSAHHALGRNEAAVAAWRKGLEFQPTADAVGIVPAARSAAALPEIESHYRGRFSQNSRDATAGQILAVIYESTGREKEALQVREILVQVFPKDQSQWMLLATACEQLGDTKRAIAAYERAAELGDDVKVQSVAGQKAKSLRDQSQ